MESRSVADRPFDAVLIAFEGSEAPAEIRPFLANAFRAAVGACLCGGANGGRSYGTSLLAPYDQLFFRRPQARRTGTTNEISSAIQDGVALP